MWKAKHCHNELLLPSTEHKECELHRFTFWLLIKNICLAGLSKISVCLEQSYFSLDDIQDMNLLYKKLLTLWEILHSALGATPALGEQWKVSICSSHKVKHIAINKKEFWLELQVIKILEHINSSWAVSCRICKLCWGWIPALVWQLWFRWMIFQLEKHWHWHWISSRMLRSGTEVRQAAEGILRAIPAPLLV